MLSISRSHKRWFSLSTIMEPEPSPFRMSLYSNEYTSDRLPRQKSLDFISAKDYGSQIGMPDQFQLHENIWLKMTKAVQLWLFDALCLAAYGYVAGGLSPSLLKTAKMEWKQYLDDGRCFTNRSGTDNHHDYINGTNVTASDMLWEPLLCGGNVVEITGPGVMIPKRYFGVRTSYRHYPVRALDPLKLPDVAAFLKDPCVCHKPTTIKPTGEHGTFPQFGGKAVYPLWAVGGKAWVWDRLLSG